MHTLALYYLNPEDSAKMTDAKIALFERHQLLQQKVRRKILHWPSHAEDDERQQRSVMQRSTVMESPPLQVLKCSVPSSVKVVRSMPAWPGSAATSGRPPEASLNLHEVA